MTETVQIVYIADGLFENDFMPVQDPFYDVLKEIDANVSLHNAMPRNFEEIDLLILHPRYMSPEIFETISLSKSQNPDIKTVVISSTHGSDLFLQAIDVGVDKYLLKPLLPGGLKKVAERLVKHSMDGKLAKKAFKQINLMFSAISETSLLGRAGEHGIIIEVNALLANLLGYASSEMVSSHWMRFVERRFRSKMRSSVREQLQEGEIYRGILELLTSKGETITVDATLYAVRGGHGEIEEIVFIGRDMSEVNRAILASMEQLIDHDTSLAVLFDNRHNAVLVNRKFLELKGYSDNQTFFASCDMCTWMVEQDESLVSLLPENSSQKEALERIFDMMGENKLQGHRIVATDAQGKKCYFTIHTTSMPNPMIQNEEYHILYFVDVSHLEQMKEEKLSDAKLMTVGRLAAAITHEINTPITYIKGNLELLKWECEDKIADAASLFGPIDEGIERIESIVGSMYEFAGTGKEEMQPCNIHMTLVYALRILFNRSKHIAPITINGEVFTYATKYSADGCLTMGISTRLEQVWIIIINNALDEFEKGAIAYDTRHIDLCFSCTAEEILITISDNAGGIPEPMLEGIFDFAISGEKKKSMGIGLNVAKAIVDKHGGMIRVANKNQGAEFEIKLKTYEEKK